MSESKPVVLRSTANPTIRHLVRMRDNRARRKAGRVLVDGWRETAQAIEAGLQVCGIFLPESMRDCQPDAGSQQPDFSSQEADVAGEAVIRRVVEFAIANGKDQWVSHQVMEKIGYGQSFRGVVAEFARPGQSLDQLQLPATPLILVLDRIEKPGNIGAVFRSADAAGVDAILLCESSDRFNPNAIRASLGSVFHVPSASGSPSDLAEFLGDRNIRVVAARLEESVPLWSANLDGPLAVVLGSESDGLGTRWQLAGNTPVQGIRIPMHGEVDSLNISVSAAVIAYEASRRRKTGRTR